MLHSQSADVLRTAAADPRLSEDLALALLTRRDLTDRVLDALSKNVSAMKSRKVLNALVRHPRTPRHLSLPIARRLYTFELMQLALTPGIAVDLKMVAEEAVINRLESISSGERLALSRRASGRVAAALLVDPEARIIAAALDNPQMTESLVVPALMKDETPTALIKSVAAHGKWSLRREIRIALLRNPNTPLATAITVAQALPSSVLREVLRTSRLAENIRVYLLQQLESRKRS
jgi:hypothetical protein